MLVVVTFAYMVGNTELLIHAMIGDIYSISPDSQIMLSDFFYDIQLK